MSVVALQGADGHRYELAGLANTRLLFNRLAWDEGNAVVLDVRRPHEEVTAVVIRSDETETS